MLGKFEVDLPRQSWLRGKLPLFNQLVVATVYGLCGLGDIAVNRCSCGGRMEAVVMLWLLLAFWPKYLSGMLFSP